MKRYLIGVVVLMMLSGVAEAITPDSVVLTVTPVYTLSVNITNTSTNFGLLSMGSSKTLNVGNICNDGNVSTHWEKQASDSAGWKLKAGGTPLTDEFTLLAIATGTAADPSFEGASSNDSIMKLAKQENCRLSSGVYTDLTDGLATTSSVFVALKTMNLWVSIKMPTDVTISAQQTITLSVQATTPD